MISSEIKVGDLVLVHGVQLAVVTFAYTPRGLWLVKLMDGTELALWTEDIEPIKKENDNGNDNNGKAEV